jgi:hypothetical protein
MVVVKASELIRLRKLERLVRRIVREFDKETNDRIRATDPTRDPRHAH